MNAWEIFYLITGLLAGGTIGGFAMAFVAAGNRSARNVVWAPDRE